MDMDFENNTLSIAEKLYKVLNTEKYKTVSYKTDELGEGMAVLFESMGEWWKLRYLLNHNKKCAYEFMNEKQELVAVTENDIDWESLKDLPEEAIECAKRRSAQYPTFIHNFINGVAEVSWQINPDGYYYMDGGGFGMTNDEEIEIYGFIDQCARIVVKFKHIKNYEELHVMRKQAEDYVKAR